MEPYHKIQTVFHRDPETNHRTLLEGVFSMPEFEYLQPLLWVWTEKIDGTNIRVHFDGEDQFTFFGRTERAQIPTHLRAFLQDMTNGFDRSALRAQFPDGVTFYGEGYGAKIQKGGGNYRQDPGFCLFDVKVGGWWLTRESVEEIAAEWGMDIAPVVGEMMIESAIELVKAGFNSQWGEFQAEGLVGVPKVALTARNGKRIITKLKCKDFVNV